MSNPQELKDALRAVLVEKGDYATLAKMMREDDNRSDKQNIYKLIKPFSALADMLTSNTDGVFMENLIKRLDTDVEKATKELKEDIKDAQATLTKEIQSTLETDRNELSAEIVSRVAEAQDALETAQARYADELVNAKAEAMFANLADLARLTDDEIADIIERSALSVESQIQSIMGEYIRETGITTDQITDFKAEVKKLIPQYDFSKLRITSAQVSGLPDFSGAASRAWVEKKIANLSTNTGSGIPDGGTTGQALVKQSNADGDADWETVAGSGDMLMSVYDTDEDGKVNEAEAVEGTGVKSTGEAGGVKFLREDGDGTCSWQPATATVADGDKGDITVSGTGATWTIDNGAVTLAKQADMATASLVYRKTAGAGAPEVQSLATLKTDLGLTGTNSGDQDLSGLMPKSGGEFTGDITMIDGKAIAFENADENSTLYLYNNGGTGASVLQTDVNFVSANIASGATVSNTNTGDQTLPTRDSLGLDTDDSPQFAGINLGHASDTTLARVSAGVIAVEGVTLATTTITDGKENYHGVQSYGTLSFNNTTHVVTLGAGTNTYWYQGVKYTTSSAITCDLDETTDRDGSATPLQNNTLYFIYFKDATGKLYWSPTVWDLKTKVPVATVFWNGSAGSVCREYHNHTRDLDWHTNAHLTIGARYYSGLGMTAPTTVADATLTITAGSIYDEDLVSTISEQTTSRIWYQVSAGVYTFVDSSLPYAGTSGNPQYLDTDTYTLTDTPDNRWVNYWVYATPDIDRPIHIIPTQASTPPATLNEARAETPPSLSGLNVAPEMKLIWKFIYDGDGNFLEAVDYRNASVLPAGGTASSTASSVSFIPSGNIEATTVQTAIEELDTEKAAVAQTMFIGTTSTAINRSSAAQTLAGITLTTPDIGTPSAGTLTNCTGLPVAGITASTATALGVGTIELGHASDTTLARVSAGVASIEGNNILTTATGLPLAGGTLTGAVQPADHGTATNPEIVAVVYGTGTPPTANTTPIGTLWVKYTA